MMDPKATLQHMLASRHVDFRWLVLMALFGVLLIAVPVWLSLSDLGTRRTADRFGGRIIIIGG